MPEHPAQPQQTVLRTFTHAVVKTTSIIGGLYVVRGYMRDRLDDVRVKMEIEQRAREVLRTRFQQTQEDTSYTILALLPTLSAQVLQTMDVDAITRELQLRSRARNTGARQQIPPPLPPIANATYEERPPSSLSLSMSTADADGVLVDASVSASGAYPPNPYPYPYQTKPSNSDAAAATGDDSKSDVSSSSLARSHPSDARSHSTSSSSSYRGSPSASASASLPVDHEAEGSGISSSFVSDAGSVTRSWVVSGEGSERAHSPAASSAMSSSSMNDAGGTGSTSGSVAGEADQHMSESVVSVNTDTTRTSASGDSEIRIGAGAGVDGRSKAELWNEVKMLTVTRTLTTLYSTTLLCLLTTIQLTILARLKYVTAVRAQEKEERRRERMQSEMPSVGGMVLGGLVGGVFGGGGLGGVFGGGGGMGGFEKLLSQLEAGAGAGEGGFDSEEEEDGDDADRNEEDDGWGFGWGSPSPSQSQAQSHSRTRTSNGKPHSHSKSSRNVHTHARAKGGIWMGEVSEEAESKYLTMSWWLLHVGWKDMGERVRRGVEEVFDGVSLKTKLTAGDLHRLIADVRRRVECEITFEGNEKRTNFLSSLLPPTPETIHHVLLQGGFTPSYSQEGEGLAYRDRQHIDVDVDVDVGMNLDFDLDLGRDLRSGSGYETQSSRSRASRPQHQHQEQRLAHDRKPSDASTSLESSQLSHNFVNSPAMSVSSRHPHPQHPPHHYQEEQAEDTTYISAPPPPPPTLHLDAPFLALVEETRGVLGGADFGRVLEGCLDRAVEVLLEGMEGNVFARAAEGGGAGGAGDANGDGERVRLAGLLPGLARWSQLAMEGLPNELVDKILNMREVSCLSAVAFGRFEEQFAGV